MKSFFQNIPPNEREELIDQFCLKYPTWFFEWLTELEGEPFVLEGFQIEYLLDDSPFKISNKTRQAGGSLVVAAAKFWKAYRNEHFRCDIVSVNLKEAKGKITYVRNLWESLPLKWRHPLSLDNAHSIGFHQGASRSEINSLAASSGIRGGKKDVVFDEAAHIPTFADLYVAALPATIRGKGGFDVVSTPLGLTGKYSEIWHNDGGNYEEWKKFHFLWFDVSYFTTDSIAARNAWENEYEKNWSFMPELLERFGTDRLKRYARTFTQEEFEQEFCGRFIDESTAFYPWQMILKCQKPDEPQKKDDTEYVEKWFSRPIDNDHEVFMGIDFAEGRKGGDSTSLQVIERSGDMVLHRFYEDLDHSTGYGNFDSQLKRINDLIDKFRPQRVRCDSTGLGLHISHELKTIWGSIIEPVNFNVQSKEEMALNLKDLLEKERIWLQGDNKRLAGQIHNVKRTISSAGNIRYSGEPHDDMFWALALACKGTARSKFRVLTL